MSISSHDNQYYQIGVSLVIYKTVQCKLMSPTYRHHIHIHSFGNMI